MTLQGNKLPVGMKEKGKKRIGSWLTYEQNKDTGKSFTEISSIHSHLNIIFEIFMKNQIEFFRAPYLAFAQLSWLYNDEKLIHSIYGGDENLLYNVNRVIFSMNFSSGTFEYIDKKDLLSSLNISNEKFIDISLLSGCYFNDTFPIHDSNIFQNPNIFQKFLDIILKWDKAQNLLMITPNLDFQRNYFRSKVLIENHVILTSKCQTQILEVSKCPPFFKDIIGPKLPDDIYFYVSQNIISPFIMNNLITGQLIEQIPLIDTNELRTLSSETLSIQTLAINLILPLLNNLLQNRQIYFIRWFDQKPILLKTQPLKMEKFKFKLDDTEITSSLKKEHKSKSDYQFVALKLNQKDEKGDRQLSKLKEAHAYILIRTLELLGYYDKENQLNSFGKAISLAKIYPAESLILIELYKSKNLKNSSFSVPNCFIALGDRKDNYEEIQLISRVLSLIPMSFDKNSWKGPADFDLVSFNCFVTNYYKSIRNLTEMILLESLLTKRVNVPLKKLNEFSIKLPYYQENNVAMGLISKIILSCSNDEIENKMKEIPKLFPNCLNPLKDLKNGIDFWNQFIKIISVLQDKELNDQFQKADSFLQLKIQKIKQFF